MNNKFLMVGVFNIVWSLFYLLVGFNLGIFILTIMGLLNVFIGIIYIFFSKYKKKELLKKHKLLIIISIISFVTSLNLVSLTILIIINSDLRIRKKTKDSKDKKLQSSVNNNSNKIDALLKLGILLVLVSVIIFSVSTWGLINASIKFLLLMPLTLMFTGLCKFAYSYLKLKSTSKLYFLMASFTFLFSYLLLMDTAFFHTILLESIYLYYSILFLLIAGLSVIYNIIFKSEVSIYISHTSFILLFHYLCFYFNLDLKWILLIYGVLCIVLGLLKYRSLSDITKNVLFLLNSVIILLNFVLYNDNLFLATLFLLISSISLLNFEFFNLKNVLNKLVPLLLGYNLYIYLFCSGISAESILTSLSIFFTGSLIVLYIKNLKIINSYNYFITFNVFIFILAMISCFASPSINVFVAFTIITPLLVIKVLKIKSELIEKETKLNIFKILFLIFSVANYIDFCTYIGFDYLIFSLALACLYCSIYFKNKDVKTFLIIIYYILFLFLNFLVNLNVYLPMYMLVVLMFVLEMIHYVNVDPENIKSRNRITTVCKLMFIEFAIFKNHGDSKIFFAIVLAFFFLYLYKFFKLKNNKKLSELSLLLSVVSIFSLTTLFTNYMLYICAYIIEYVIIILGISWIYIKNKKGVFTILLTILPLANMISSNNAYFLLTAILLSILFIILSYKIKIYQILYKYGFILLIISIFRLTYDMLILIPFWIYLLIIGLGIIGYVTFKEINNK